ncbi:MAG TPA: sigma-70 family RNA polymerase sigma factor, partial [Pyrinomonadaceae bacterium]|nr:sigma-70 family RNA polymerase sigma factor [Pyrinomonadaceae bacterium]
VISQALVPIDELTEETLSFSYPSLWHAPTPAESLEKRDRAQHLAKAMSRLSSRQQVILKMHHGLGLSEEHTLQEIGFELGVSAPRVSQIEQEAMKKLKDELCH